MTRGTVPIDYAYCGSTNFIPSRRILKIAEMVDQVKKGSRDPVVRKKAFDLARAVCIEPLDVKGLAAENLSKIAEAIFIFVRDKIAYINDPSGEYFQPAVKTLEVGAGDCDDQSILLAAMLGAIGFEPILVVLPDHVYVELEVGGKTMPMDPTSNAPFGSLSPSMEKHFEEKYRLKFEDYLRVPIADHLIVTETNQIVKTKTPLQMAMYLEKKAAALYDERDYRAAETRFAKAAKMYQDAALHADSRDVKEGLMASSTFCMGWEHLTRVLHQVLNQKNDDLHMLQAEINQAKSCFKISKQYFEKFNNGAAEIAREVDALEGILDGHREVLLADFLKHLEDHNAALRHYGKARELYKEAKTKTELPSLRSHIEQSLDSLSYYESVSQTSAQTVETATGKSKISAEENLSEQYDIPPEEVKRIRERLVNLTGEQLRKEFLAISLESGIPISILEALYNRSSEIRLRVDYPHQKDKYGSVVRVHPKILERLGLQKLDHARIVFGVKKHIVTVQPLDVNDHMDVIRINKTVRDVLGVKIGDRVKLERASIGMLNLQ